MKTAHTQQELRHYLDLSGSGERGFVPTMGALHAGHMSLVERARRENGTVVASIFVNPTQFNDKEDLRRYPRTPEKDLRMLREAGADIVFMPSPEEVYPEPDTRVFDLGMVDKVMEGATRPGHFNGVAQVVSRLFDLVRPTRAYFGEKDFQQIAVIRAMVELLGLEVEIVPCPIVREADGLAMSSRNTLLDAPHRKAAPEIYEALREAVERRSEMTPQQLENYVTERINSNPLLDVIYFELVDRATLKRIALWPQPTCTESFHGVQGCVAVQAGAVRLIDNIRFL